MNKQVSINCFGLLQIPVTFTIDMEKLEKNYLKLQQQQHPDILLRNNKSPPIVSNLSAELNQAYQILKNPVTRAKAILEHFNWEVDNQNSADFLEEVFNFNQMLAEQKLTKDHGVDTKYQTALQDFAIAIAQKDRQQAIDSYKKIIYWSKLKDA